jgi:hypothetical protein
MISTERRASWDDPQAHKAFWGSQALPSSPFPRNIASLVLSAVPSFPRLPLFHLREPRA